MTQIFPENTAIGIPINTILHHEADIPTDHSHRDKADTNKHYTLSRSRHSQRPQPLEYQQTLCPIMKQTFPQTTATLCPTTKQTFPKTTAIGTPTNTMPYHEANIPKDHSYRNTNKHYALPRSKHSQRSQL